MPRPLPLDISLNIQLRKMGDDPRWMKVRSHTLVKWEGHWVRFDSLAGNERTMLEFESDGTLSGGYPI